ncbi:MAG TPA: hypothetical protein ENN42_01120 [Thioalkalivibrio sp.]|nr:hypothetical protein [Thioalkalivibrio sp.]
MRKTPRQDREQDAGSESAEDAVGPIRDVLVAEHEAAETLRRCHEEARQLLEAGRARARAIEFAAEARIHRIHQIRERQVAALHAQSGVSCQLLRDQASDPVRDATLVEAAVATVVARLFEGAGNDGSQDRD